MLHPAVLTLSLAVFATMLGNCMFMSFLPIYVQQFGFGELGAGLLFSVHAATRTLILPFIGRLSDRWERKYFLLAGLFFYTATSFAYLPADTVASFILIMIVHGTATAIMHPVVMAYVGDLALAGQEGRYSGSLNTAMLGGVAGGPLLGGVIKDVWGMPANFPIHGRDHPGFRNLQRHAGLVRRRGYSDGRDAGVSRCVVECRMAPSANSHMTSQNRYFGTPRVEVGSA